jgi:ribose 5-phosphate isomerase B
MNVVFASDHAGYALKKELIAWLRSETGHTVSDVGTDSEASCDYPDYAVKAARAVLDGAADRAILVCGTGIGIGIAANKVRDFRCAICTNETMASFARRHNDAQGIAFGSRIVGIEVAKSMIRVFLSEPFEGGRHLDRVKKIGSVR